MVCDSAVCLPARCEEVCFITGLCLITGLPVAPIQAASPEEVCPIATPGHPPHSPAHHSPANPRPVEARLIVTQATSDPLFDNIPVSQYCLPVKTTIDFPEHLLHRAKTIAVQRKITLKDLVIQGLEHAIRQPAEDVEAERKARAAALIAALSAGKNTEPIGPLNRDEIYDRQQGKWD